MVSCKCCSLGGFFAGLNEHGLCDNCSLITSERVDDCQRLIEKVQSLNRQPDSFEKIMHSIAKTVSEIEQLLIYIERGIYLGDDVPLILIKEVQKQRTEALQNQLDLIVRTGLKAANSASSPRLRQHSIRLALVELKALQKKYNLSDPDQVHEMMLVTAQETYGNDDSS